MVATDVNVRKATSEDGAALAAIYNHYIEHTDISFEEEPISAASMVTRLRSVEDAALSWLVAEAKGRVVGYAYAAPWNNRCAYRSSVEISVYLNHQQRSAGLGSLLYRHLFDDLRTRDLHVAVAGIALPNAASVALHEKFGMHQVAQFEQIGYKFGRWIDVGYWQVLLAKSEGGDDVSGES